MTAPTIVGAYAAMPRAIAERECLYRGLAETGWVDGIEIPYRDGLDADPRWLADQLRDRFAHCVVTAIPGTMGQLAGDPDFGLASSDEQGRQRALKWFTNLVDDVRTLHEMVGHPVVRWVEVHSAREGIRFFAGRALRSLRGRRTCRRRRALRRGWWRRTGREGVPQSGRRDHRGGRYEGAPDDQLGPQRCRVP